ncbi:hypothetical protein [Cytobacillus firmus]|uniref:hypothetical protein n=1 Tax=Cytobacillus firmus TaxID=1399 RepID=UPI0018CED6F7|nr:hypothetical protein [Cytobacillus firmus]MBG9550025.1 hypothetical protein [Cytobacillus firmus]MBG9605010.1 hypothetical protein [Cytobacillus firmus]MED1940811.1 hypothetical protein [Cytobacillus firmus]
MASIKNPNNCSNCGSSNFDFVSPSTGTSYVLTTVDQTKNPPAFNPTSGLPVAVFGCLDCGVLTFHVESLRRS